ncbi:MAG: alpha-L-fucosidase [Kiritimatiellia bacterium]
MKPIMNRFSFPSIALLAFLSCAPSARSADPAPRAPAREALVPTEAEKDARLGWWREARFGMFVHWGVYSSLSGTWNGKAYGGYGEHIQRMAKIPCAVYRKEVAGSFNPVEFNADEWIRLAKEAGMGYFVITAKHHDGFAMYESKVSDYNIVKATPFARDPMKELRDACKKHGIKFGFYYSHAFDWGEENGPGNDWDYDNPGGDKLLHGANWWEKFPEFLPRARTYVDEKSIPQLRELIANYDPDIIWFDTPHKLPPEENLRILAAVRKAKPTLVVNGRLVSGLGDYASTCDRPAEFPQQAGDWEGVPTTNESYGYNQNDKSHKPPAHFIQLLAKSAARGGNQLMNIGPTGRGRIDEADAKILRGIGAWWRVYGDSIRGTTRTPLAVQAWGESTRKENLLYLHVFEWPRDGRLVVGGLTTPAAQGLADERPRHRAEDRPQGFRCVHRRAIGRPGCRGLRRGVGMRRRAGGRTRSTSLHHGRGQRPARI